MQNRATNKGRPAFAKNRLVRIGVVETFQKTVCFFFNRCKGCIDGFFTVHHLVDFAVNNFTDLNIETKAIAFGPVTTFFRKLLNADFCIRAFCVVAVFFSQLISSVGDRNVTGFFVPVVLGFRFGQEFKEFSNAGILFGTMTGKGKQCSATDKGRFRRVTHTFPIWKGRRTKIHIATCC